LQKSEIDVGWILVAVDLRRGEKALGFMRPRARMKSYNVLFFIGKLVAAWP